MKTLLAVLVLFSFSALADVPHILRNGEVVDANQLNENFAYLDGKRHVVRANGTIVGTSKYLGQFIYLSFSSDFQAVSLMRNGKIGSCSLYFKELDCMGEAFSFGGYSDTGFYYPPNQGLACDINSSLYYSYNPAQIYKFVFKSWGNANGCTNQTGSADDYFFKLHPNDPSITGVHTYPFPTPITVDGAVELSIVQ